MQWPEWKESMADKDPMFSLIIGKTLMFEGGYVDDRDDPGGATNYGISLRFLKGINPKATKDTIKKLTKDQAKELYYVHFWKRHGFDKFPTPIAGKLFDITVNSGSVTQAIKILQRALRAVTLDHIANDGYAGPATMGAIQKSELGEIMAAFRSEHAAYYRELVAKKPIREKWKDGWLARAYS